MNNLLTTRNLTLINFIIVAYFSVIWLINFYKIDYTLVGIFRELLTIPFIVAELFFLVLGIKQLIKNQSNLFLMISLLFLAGSTVITVGSFFVK